MPDTDTPPRVPACPLCGGAELDLQQPRITRPEVVFGACDCGAWVPVHLEGDRWVIGPPPGSRAGGPITRDAWNIPAT